MKSLIKIINLHFWKSIISPFFAFGFPVIFIALLGSLLGYYNMFGGLLAISAMAVSLTSMPQAIFEFKRSSLLKRIGVTPIKPWMFILVAMAYYIVVMILGTFFSIIIGIAVFSTNMDKGKVILDSLKLTIDQTGEHAGKLISLSLKTMLANVNWGGFIYAMLLNILVGTSIGMFLVSVSKSTIMLQGIGVPILILSQFLSAQVLPIDLVKKIDTVWYLGYISPFKSTTALILQSWNPPTSIEWVAADGGYWQQIVANGSFNIFDINSNYSIVDSKSGAIIQDVFSKPERVLNMLFPFIWIGLFGGLSLKLFKWSTR